MVEDTDTALAQTQKLKMIKKSKKETQKSAEKEEVITGGEQQSVKKEVTVTKNEQLPIKEDMSVTEEEQQPVKEEITVAEEEELVKEEITVAEEEELVKEEITVAEEEQQPVKEEITVAEEEQQPVKEEITVAEEEQQPVKEEITVAEEEQQPVKEEITVAEEEQQPVKEKVIIAEETRGNKAMTSAAVWKPVPPPRMVAARNEEIRDPKGGASSKHRLQHQLAEVRMLRTRCGQLGTSLFFHEQAAVRSLGFTSAIDGEGKSFLARLAAEAMAKDNNVPVTLLECNWEHPDLENLFGLKRGAGLAEWLRGDCRLEAIRQQVGRNLTVIPAGKDRRDAVRLLQQFRQKGVLNVLVHPDEVLIVDLPSVVMTTYGPLAASLVEALVIVVRAGVTPDSLVAEACANLKDLRVHGIILNQVESRIPRWLRQLL